MGRALTFLRMETFILVSMLSEGLAGSDNINGLVKQLTLENSETV